MVPGDPLPGTWRGFCRISAEIPCMGGMAPEGVGWRATTSWSRVFLKQTKTSGTHEPVFLEHFWSAFHIPLLVAPKSDKQRVSVSCLGIALIRNWLGALEGEKPPWLGHRMSSSLRDATILMAKAGPSSPAPVCLLRQVRPTSLCIRRQPTTCFSCSSGPWYSTSRLCAFGLVVHEWWVMGIKGCEVAESPFLLRSQF